MKLLIRIVLITIALAAGLFAFWAQTPKLKPRWIWIYTAPLDDPGFVKYPYSPFHVACFARYQGHDNQGYAIFSNKYGFRAISLSEGKLAYSMRFMHKSLTSYDYNDDPKFIWNPSVCKQSGSNLLAFRSVDGIGKSPGGAEVILFRLSDGKRLFKKFYPKWYSDGISVNGDKILLSMFKFRNGVARLVLLDTKSLSITDNLIPYLSKNGPSRWFTVGEELYYFKKEAKPSISSLNLVDFQPTFRGPQASEAQYT